MIIRCPSCGCENSLEALIDHDEAAQALTMVLDMLPIGKELTRYLSLFRPAKSKLSWSRVNQLLGELLPLIKAEKIERNGVDVSASMPVWKVALEKTILARDNGSLKTPLKTHGYLFEVICTESQKAMPIQVSRVELNAIVKPLSATAQALENLERMKK
jgi:hypothetical protein